MNPLAGSIGGRHLSPFPDLAEERLCCLVIVGVRADGTKELVAIADGYRESTGSWHDTAPRLQAAGDAGPGGDGPCRGVGDVVGVARASAVFHNGILVERDDDTKAVA